MTEIFFHVDLRSGRKFPLTLKLLEIDNLFSKLSSGNIFFSINEGFKMGKKIFPSLNLVLKNDYRDFLIYLKYEILNNLVLFD